MNVHTIDRDQDADVLTAIIESSTTEHADEPTVRWVPSAGHLVLEHRSPNSITTLIADMTIPNRRLVVRDREGLDLPHRATSFTPHRI